MDIFSEIDFSIVSDRGEEYLTAAFRPTRKNIVPSRSYRCQRSAHICVITNCTVDFQSRALKNDLKNLSSPTVFEQSP